MQSPDLRKFSVQYRTALSTVRYIHRPGSYGNGTYQRPHLGFPQTFNSLPISQKGTIIQKETILLVSSAHRRTGRRSSVLRRRMPPPPGENESYYYYYSAGSSPLRSFPPMRHGRRRRRKKWRRCPPAGWSCRWGRRRQGVWPG